MSNSQSNDAPRYIRWLKNICLVIGIIMLAHWIVTGPTQYDVKLVLNPSALEDDRTKAYLVARTWWGCWREEYPLHYFTDDDPSCSGWRYRKDGKWHSMDGTPIDEDVNARWLWESPDW